jgi:hypothetical protein
MQTCENNTCACEIPMNACRFLNIFLLRHAHFSEHTLDCDVNSLDCDVSTLECDVYTQRVISTRTSVIYTDRM